MGRHTREGESPVSEKRVTLAESRVLRDTRNRRGKTGGPPSKPKYYLLTDRGAVPWGKGEKDPGRGVKENLKPCAYKHSEHVKVWWGTFCRTVRRVIVCSKLKVFSTGGEARASLNRAYEVACNRPETRWPIHGQVEVEVKLHGGPNRPPLQWWRMTCG